MHTPPASHYPFEFEITFCVSFKYSATAARQLVSPGEEASQLANLPLEALFVHDTRLDAGLLEILHQWGLKTCEDLAGLPESAIAERLGLAGVYLRSLALGQRTRPRYRRSS